MASIAPKQNPLTARWNSAARARVWLLAGSALLAGFYADRALSQGSLPTLTPTQCAAQGGNCDASNNCVKFMRGRDNQLQPVVIGRCGSAGGGEPGGGGGGPRPIQSDCMRNPSNETCNGKDPVWTGCAADAVTPKVNGASPLLGLVNGKEEEGGKVEVRYSPKCKSAWSRVTSSRGRGFMIATIMRENTTNGEKLRAPLNPIGTSNVTTLQSPMLYAPAGFITSATGSLNLAGGRSYSGQTTPSSPRK